MKKLEEQSAGIPNGGTLAGILFLAAMVAFNVLERSTPFLLRHLPSALEERLGAVITSSLLSEQQTKDQEELQTALEKILASLQESPFANGVRLKLHVLTSPQIAAFSFPGGDLLVTSGLIVETRSSAEFTGILAHEIAHLVLQHSRNHLAESLRFSEMLGMLFLPAERPPISAALLAPGFLSVRYSPEEEQAANDLAKNMLHDLHISLGPLQQFFRRTRVSEVGLPADLSFSIIHPSAEVAGDSLEGEPLAEPEWDVIRKLTGFLPVLEMESYGTA